MEFFAEVRSRVRGWTQLFALPSNCTTRLLMLRQEVHSVYVG